MQRSIEQRSMKTMNNSEIFPVKEVLACLTHSPQVKYHGTHFFLIFIFISHSPDGFTRTHYRVLSSLSIQRCLFRDINDPLRTHPVHGESELFFYVSIGYQICCNAFSLLKINPNYRTIYSLITFFCLSILPIHDES